MKNLFEAATVRELEARMLRLRPTSARQWGEMTVHQMICHVADSYDIVLAGRCGTPIKTPLPGPVMKWLALNVPMRWPKNVPTVPEVKQGLGGTPPAEWERDHERLLQVFQAFCQKRERWPGHPIFREMTERDWMRWGYLHPDHHLRQFGV